MSCLSRSWAKFLQHLYKAAIGEVLAQPSLGSLTSDERFSALQRACDLKEACQEGGAPGQGSLANRRQGCVSSVLELRQGIRAG
jgi:hypothetical protein